MLAIQINDPELEAFYREEYENDAAALAQQFMALLREQCIRHEVKQAQEEIARGEFVSLDEAVNAILERYREG